MQGAHLCGSTRRRLRQSRWFGPRPRSRVLQLVVGELERVTRRDRGEDRGDPAGRAWRGDETGRDGGRHPDIEAERTGEELADGVADRPFTHLLLHLAAAGRLLEAREG